MSDKILNLKKCLFGIMRSTLLPFRVVALFSRGDKYNLNNLTFFKRLVNGDSLTILITLYLSSEYLRYFKLNYSRSILFMLTTPIRICFPINKS